MRNPAKALVLLGLFWAAASGFTSCGASGGFTGPALIETNPTQVDLVGSLAAGNPAPQTVTVTPATATYRTSIEYEATPPAAWLTATVNDNGSAIQVAASLAGLTPGVYRATVKLSRRGASTEFYVELTVIP